jgi:undecaprenyl-diphosphatase
MISNLVGRQKNDLIRDITALGSLFFYVLLIFLFLLLKNYDIFRRLLMGLVIIYPVTIIFRTFLFKNRPKKIKYDSYIEKLDATSFPSLHAARTAAMAAILVNFFNNFIISILLLFIALAIAYSRIYLKKHDWKDVLGGIVLGILAYFSITFIY